MNNHQFLVSEREQGRYDEYMRRGLIGLNLNEWMEVYQYHLEHPEASTWLVAASYLCSATDEGCIMREIKPNLAQAGTRKCTHTNGNGTHYPFLRQFGAKHCHFLVAGAWYGPRPEGMVIDHLNGNILDWSADNLEYVTPEENRKRARLLRVLRSIGRDPKQMSREELLSIFSKYTFTNPQNLD